MRFLPSKTDRAAFGEIANEYDLVYFGRVDPRTDTDYVQVGGLTMGVGVVDENYTTGNVYDYEVEFLQRTRKVHRYTNGAEAAATRWSILQNAVKKTMKKSDIEETDTRKRTILQVKLKHVQLPHIFVCGRNRLRDYATLINAAERWQEIGWQSLPQSSQTGFPQDFATFIVPTHVAWLPYILPATVQAMLSTNFSQFDYELFEKNLIVYSTDDEIKLEILDHMLRVGLWWTRNIDAVFAQSDVAT